MFRKTRERAAAVKAAPGNAKEMGKAALAGAARNAGRQVVRLGTQCRQSPTKKHQAAVPDHHLTSGQWQLIECRHCQDIMGSAKRR